VTADNDPPAPPARSTSPGWITTITTLLAVVAVTLLTLTGHPGAATAVGAIGTAAGIANGTRISINIHH
jgi:hypothetical protein